MLDLRYLACSYSTRLYYFAMKLSLAALIDFVLTLDSKTFVKVFLQLIVRSLSTVLSHQVVLPYLWVLGELIMDVIAFKNPAELPYHMCYSSFIIAEFVSL